MRGRKPKRSNRGLRRGAPIKNSKPLEARKALVRKTPLRTKRKRTMTPAAMAAQRANSAKRVHVRRGRTLVCSNPECLAEFYAHPGQIGRKYCSRRCMGLMQRKVRQRRCPICDESFELKPGQSRKTCSTACRNEAVRRGKLGSKNPAYTGSTRQPTRAWKAAREARCRICRSTRRLTQHHVVYQQHVRKRGGDPWDPRDSLTSCFDCHNAHHHTADGRIHVRHLSYDNLRFAHELLGEYAADYFIRYYDGKRGEIEERLANALAAA